MNILESGDNNLMQKSCWIVWSIWFFRNAFVRRNQNSVTAQMLIFALNYLQDWKEARGRWNKLWHAVGNSQAGNRWMVPAVNCWKCNTNVASRDLNSGCGFRAVMRNNRGNYIKGISWWIDRVEHPVLAEALTSREILSWLENCGVDGCPIQQKK